MTTDDAPGFGAHQFGCRTIIFFTQRQKFSPHDPYGKYRRQLKKETLGMGE